MLNWKKFEIVYSEWDDEEDLDYRDINEEETEKKNNLVVPYAVKLKSGRTLRNRSRKIPR